MAIAAQNLVYLGQPSSSAAPGQQYSNSDPGVLGKQLIGVAQFTGDGATTSATVNWIDGVNSIFVVPVFLQLLSVTAPATIGGVVNQSVYSGVGSYGQLRVGQSVTFAGFSNAGNNGTFTINALTTSSIQVTNASSVAETNPAGTAKFNFPQGGGLSFATGWRAQQSASGVADTASATLQCAISSITAIGATVTFQLPTGVATAPANGSLISVACELQAQV